MLTGFSDFWDDNGNLLVRNRLHDEDAYEWGEVYRYDDMDRIVTMFYDVKNPESYKTSDPGHANYDEKKLYTLGPVYERDATPIYAGGALVDALDYSNNDLYQYTSVDGTTWTWDDKGQLTDKGDWAFEWTALGQLEKANPDSGDDRDYLYDAFGRRVQTVKDSQTNQYVYVGWHMVGEYDETADEWLWMEVPLNEGDGMLEHVALDTNDIDSDTNTTEYRQYAIQEDFQNTVRGINDTDPALVERYRYADPYGIASTDDASATDIGTFASLVFAYKRMHAGVVDPYVQIYDYRFRWLEPVAAIWLSRDPLGYVDSWNLQQFVRSNPLRWTDPMGLGPGISAGILLGNDDEDWWELPPDVEERIEDQQEEGKPGPFIDIPPSLCEGVDHPGIDYILPIYGLGPALDLGVGVGVGQETPVAMDHTEPSGTIMISVCATF